jgi:hypothetical protein
LKPRNKLGDILYKKEIEEGPEAIIRKGAELEKIEIEVPHEHEGIDGMMDGGYIY